MYSVRILKAAGKELERLDKSVAKRIAERIHWLAENLEDTSIRVLKGDLAGLYKLREGIIGLFTRSSTKKKLS